MIFQRTLSAIIYTLIEQYNIADKNNVVQFIIRQYSRMPDIYRLPITTLTIFFGISTIFFNGSFFYNLNPEKRLSVIDSIKKSRIRVFKDLIRFYESLSILNIYFKI